MRNKKFYKLLIISNSENNLQTVLMMCEVSIHNIIEENEVWHLKLSTSYQLTTNTEVNLPAVLMMCELLIHNMIKEKQAWAIKNFISYHLIGTLKITYLLYWWCVKWFFTISSSSKKMKHEIWNCSKVIYWQQTLK